MTDRDGLVKIHVDLPNHRATGGESLWAKPIADNLYRIENVPFFAFGLNYLDVVKAVPQTTETIPEIVSVVRPSGHTTLRCYFDASVERERQAALLDELTAFGAAYERATATFVAIDIAADGSYGEVYDQLDEWEHAGLLNFETCEQRADGSFDDENPSSA